MALALYNKKRNFKNTAEPEGKAGTANGFRFVVQRHDASHLHYDFRLELGGVLKSWAVPKGPSLNPKNKRLAMMVEDHPVSYIDFEGKIPEGNYGAGEVIVWDKGTFTPVNANHESITEKQALSAIKKGELKFSLKGKKLKGEFVLVHLKSDEKKDNSWLLIKHKDEFAEDEYNSEDYTPVAAKKASEKKANGKKKSDKVSTHNNYHIQIPAGTKKLTTYCKPMLATLTDKPFNDKDWIFEIKWDGYRAVADWEDKKLQLYSRNGLSFIEKFGVVAEAVKTIDADVVLDGEIVLLDEEGRPSFQKLQHYEDNTNLPLVYYVFDMLFLDKKDIRHLPLTDRKQLLEALLKNNKNNAIKYCSHIEEKGKDFFKAAAEQNLEGIIAKKADSEYTCGIRTKEWLKIKHQNSREGIILGYTEPRNSRKYFGALVLGQYDNGTLTYMGHTGTGFDEKTLKELWDQMQAFVTTKSPLKAKVKVNMPVTWVKPKLVCQLSYAEVTEGGLLRHPVYMGLRIDKNFTEVKKQNEEPKPLKKARQNNAEPDAGETGNGGAVKNEDKTIVVDKHQIALTHLSKIFWPDEAITKGDLIDYYEKISPYILPYLKNRPLSLKRNPNGILDDGFFQKDAGDQAPEWVEKTEVFSESNSKTIHYIMCNDKASLLYIANLGCIEINPWNSALPNLDKPSYMIIDIDPSDKNSFDEVIETALAVKNVLDKAGADTYCKTSGATGLHVYIPMGQKYTYDQIKDFGHIVASLVAEQLPAFTSLERSWAKRGDKIYIDYLQNRKGQTLACAYSARPKPGATVSAPVEWAEVKKGLHPSQFTIKNIHQRLEKKGDLFSPVLKKGIDLRKCLDRLSQ
jgi:bifunctional non-homologous end joining protein LigD